MAHVNTTAPLRHGASVLAQSARAIHGEADLDTLLAWVAEAVCMVAGGDGGGVCLFVAHTPEIHWNVSGDMGASLLGMGDPRAYPELAPALHGNEVVILRQSDGTGFRGIPALLVAPVLDGDGRPAGALFVTDDDPDALDEADATAIVALGAHLGVALDNHATLLHLASLEATRRLVVHQLQEAVRPPRPTVPHTELGVHYVASEASAPTGGDLYDWLILPNGDLHIAVVDVMGKGVAATKDALAVTHALRMLVLDGCPLEGLVAKADAILTAQNPELVATLIVGCYTPSSGQVRLVGGGHPPALLVTDQGVVELAAPGIPIGWPGAGSHGVACVELHRSDSLVFYTDGLVETTRDIVAGLSRLADLAVKTSAYPATHQARVLVERALDGAARHDDSLALVLRRRVPPTATQRQPLGPFEYRFTPNTATVPLARHFLRDWLVRLPAVPAECDDLLLAATELCANAVRHATGEPGSVALRAWAEGTDVVIEVEDDGRGLELCHFHDELPDPESETGRGLFLVSALLDAVDTEHTPGRTIVRGTRRALLAHPSPG